MADPVRPRPAAVGRLRWAPLAVAAVVGLGLLTKYERDKNTAQPVFRPPTPPASRTSTSKPAAPAVRAVDSPAYRRIGAMTSCDRLRSTEQDAADRADRLRGVGDSAGAAAWASRAQWSAARMAELGCR